MEQLSYKLLILCCAIVIIWGIRTVGSKTEAPFNSALRPAISKQTQATAIDLNTALEADLEALPCIGPARARRILAHRAEKGWFTHPNEVFQVYGLDSCQTLLVGRFFVQPDTLRYVQAHIATPVYRPRRNLNMAYVSTLHHPQLLTLAQARRLVDILEREGAFGSFSQLAHRTGWDARTLRVLAQNFYCGKRLQKLDLNRADSAQLRLIPGIGAKLAARIPKFRDALGHFHHVEQLREVYGLSEENYQRMAPFLYATAKPPHLNLRNPDEAALSRHPYLRNKQHRKTLLDWAKTLPPTAQRDTLRHAPLPPAVLEKLMPYLEF